jgi:hypothetical protein
MCCLRYEHDFYVQQRKRFPKEGKAVRTQRGEEKVVANDIFRERVTLRGTDGEVRVVLLDELRLELDAVGGGPIAIPTVTDEYEAVDVRADVDEEGEGELSSAIDIIEEPPRAESATAEPVKTPATGATPAVDAARKPHRRRGRRGGRRNRAGRERGESGGDGNDGGASGDSTPPEA